MKSMEIMKLRKKLRERKGETNTLPYGGSVL